MCGPGKYSVGNRSCYCYLITNYYILITMVELFEVVGNQQCLIYKNNNLI